MSHLFKLRITLRNKQNSNTLKKSGNLSIIHIELNNLFDKSQPYLVTCETGKNGNVHLHGVGYTQTDQLKYFRELCQEHFVSRSTAINFYTKSELEHREPSFYFGYILKESEIPYHEISNLTNEQIQEYKQHYNLKSRKVSGDLLSYVQANYTHINYNEELLLMTILDYYKNCNITYDKCIVLRRAFHLCRLHLFEDIERADIIKNKNVIID